MYVCALFSFYLCMFNNYHFIFVYFIFDLIYLYIYTHIRILYILFVILFLCVFYQFYFFMFIACVYVCWHKYILCFAFVCSYIFFLYFLNSLGVNVDTWARVLGGHLRTKVYKKKEGKKRRCNDSQQITSTHFGENKRLHLESSKRNCYITSLWVIIKAIFIHTCKDVVEERT